MTLTLGKILYEPISTATRRKWAEKIVKYFYLFRGWQVSDPSLCSGAASCSEPQALSCSFRGCGPLPKVPATKATSLSYFGTPERSLAGGSSMLLCRADTERKLTVTLASFLNPDTVVILDQEHVDDTEEEPEIPDWCPTQNCFATGKAAFKVETNEELMTNCFTGGYRGAQFLPTLFGSQPRCAKADSIVFDEVRGYVWESSAAYEDCTKSEGQPCPNSIPKGCPVTDCIHGSFPWTEPMVPGIINEGCSFAKETKVFSGTELRCPKKSEVTVVDDEIHVETLYRYSNMEECKTVDKVSEPCPNFYPSLMKKKKATKKNAEKSHQFEIKPCQDG